MISGRVFWSFKSKIVISILAIGFLAVFIGLTVTYWIGHNQIQKAIGAQFKELAYETSQKLLLLLEHNIEKAQLLAMSNEIRITTEQANQVYSSGSLSRKQVHQKINSLNQGWQESNPTPPFIRKIFENPASEYMDRFVRNSDEREEHISFILTDREGFVIGANMKPSKGYYGEEVWWKAAYGNGRGKIFVSDVELIERGISDLDQVYGLGLVVPVMNLELTRVIGIFRANIHAQRFFDAVTKVKIGQTDHTMLASSDGSLIFCPIFLIRNHTLQPEFMRSIFQDRAGWTLTDLDVHYAGRQSVNGFSPVRVSQNLHPDSMGGKQWYIFISQNPDETYASIDVLQNWMALSGAVGAVILSFFGYFVAGSIVKPLQDLREGARRIGYGNLDHRLEIKTADEIQDVADEFNEMAVKLKASYSGLEQKVTERTKELAVVNKINQTISSSLNLQLIFEILAGEVDRLIHYDQISIALMEPSQENIQTRLIKSKEGSMIIRDFPQRTKKGTAVGLAVDEAQPIIRFLPVDPIMFVEDQLCLRQGFHSYMIIPIISKKRPIGTLNLFSRKDQAFSKKNLQILNPIAEQLDIAIETIRLFEETKKLDQLKSDFVSKVSHEFRTPLTSIKGFSEILLTYDDVDTKTNREFLGIINEESERLTRLVNDILDLSKIEAGRSGGIIQPVSISDVTEYTEKLFHSLAIEKGLKIEIRIPSDLPMIPGDRDQVIQVLHNLLSNAIKFSTSGVITVAASEEDQSIRLSVSDTGNGIPQKDQEKIFDRFYQLGDVRTGKPRGTGLGLAICKEIVAILNGRIWCESEVGKGSTFHVSFPIFEEDSPPLDPIEYQGNINNT